MPQNLVSIVITKEQQEAVLALIKQIEAHLQGLITLDPKDRQRAKMGPKSERYARGVLQALKQHAALVSSGMGLDEALSDLDGHDILLPVLVALQSLTTRVEDTVTALGSDVMDTAQTGYGMLKMLGNEQGLDELRKELSYRWARSPRKKSTPANDE